MYVYIKNKINLLIDVSNRLKFCFSQLVKQSVCLFIEHINSISTF